MDTHEALQHILEKFNKLDTKLEKIEQNSLPAKQIKEIVATSPEVNEPDIPKEEINPNTLRLTDSWEIQSMSDYSQSPSKNIATKKRSSRGSRSTNRFKKHIELMNLILYEGSPVLKEETFLETFKNGILFCNWVAKLSNQKLSIMHKKPKSLQQASENFEVAFRVLYKRGVIAYNIPEAKYLFNMNRLKVIDLLNETMEVYLVREIRSQMTILSDWFRKIHSSFNLPFTFAVFEKSDAETKKYKKIHETVLFILIFYALSVPEERVTIFNVFWNPNSTEERIYNSKFCKSLIEMNGVHCFFKEEEFQESKLDTDFLLYQLLLIFQKLNKFKIRAISHLDPFELTELSRELVIEEPLEPQQTPKQLLEELSCQKQPSEHAIVFNIDINQSTVKSPSKSPKREPGTIYSELINMFHKKLEQNHQHVINEQSNIIVQDRKADKFHGIKDGEQAGVSRPQEPKITREEPLSKVKLLAQLASAFKNM